jgi:hypothetical protein
VTAAPARRLALVGATILRVEPAPVGQLAVAGPAEDETVFRSRLPGLGARFLAALAADVERRGWRAGETRGLLAAAEERCGLWLLAPRPLGRPRAAVWRAGAPVPVGGGLRALTSAAASAHAGSAVAVAATSGRRRPPAAAVAGLQRAGVPIGRLTDGLAGELDVPWALELLLAPLLAPAALAALRERIAAAPRCGWCRTPVLGSACRRCRGAAE